jgi:GNAT superfamily N-acetyltransferase
MRCVEFSPNLLSDLTRLVNTQLVTMPPGWTLTEAQVAQTVVLASDLWGVHYPEQDSGFESETLCVLDQGRLVAAAQWGYPSPQGIRTIDNSSMLLWVVAEPDKVEGLHLLLETLVGHARAAGSREITTTRFSFGAGWLGIPMSWSHVVTALQAVGFVVSKRWVILTSAVDIPEVSTPESLASMHISWQVNVNAAEWELRLHTDDTLVGECCAWGMPQHFSDCERYTAWVTVEWLGVEPGYQRKGIGRWLIAEQFRKQAQQGVTHVILWTEINNQPLRSLGESLGFHSGPEYWEFQKAIG